MAAGGETNSGFQQRWPIGEANASLIGEAVLERVVRCREWIGRLGVTGVVSSRATEA